MTTVSTLKINLDSESASFDNDLKKAEQRLRSFSRNAKAANDSNGGLSRSFRSAGQAVTAFDSPLSSVSGKLGSMQSVVSSTSLAWGAFGAAVAAATTVLVKSVSAFSEMEQQQLRTEALLKATGNSAGFTAAELDDMARSVAMNTLASTQGIRDAQATLLTFKSVSGDTFRETIELSQDMAAVFGTDVKSAAMQLGKALEEPTQGLSALRRSGVSFTDSQKEMIRTMEDSGRIADAQKIILGQLSAQIGGAGAAEAGGLIGSVDTLGQRWEEFLEAVGETTGVATLAERSLDLLSRSLDGLTQMINPEPQVRINELLRERIELEEELASRTKEHGGVGLWDALTGKNTSKGQLRTRIDEINQEIGEIQEARKQEIIAEGKAQEQAAAAQAEREKAIADKKLKDAEIAEQKKLEIQQAAGARALTALETQMADEETRLGMANTQRLQQIEELQLTEEEITRRGFETLEELKEEFRLRAEEKHQEDLEALRLRKEEEAQIEIEAEKKKQAELAANQSKWDATVTAMQMNLAQQSLGFISSVAEEGSAIWVAATIAQKALAITQAIINTEIAATRALAELGPIAGPPMAAAMKTMGYASVGLIAAQGVAELAGAREKGGHVGFRRSYLVGERGPEIFTPGASGQITSNANMMKAMSSGQAANGPAWKVIIHEAPPGTTATIDEQSHTVAIAVGQAERNFVEQMDRGGPMADAYERNYGGNRGALL